MVMLSIIRVVAVLTACHCFMYAESKKNIDLFLVPEELPTILNIIYSRLPPIKIGSDQRFGLGFRLGRNADAQFLVELGPQSETQPLGDNPSKRESRRGKFLGGGTTTEDPAWNAVDSDTRTEDTQEAVDYQASKQEARNDTNTEQSETEQVASLGRSVDEQTGPETILSTFVKWLTSFFHQR